MAVTINELLNWINSNDAVPADVAEGYTQEQLDVYERCLDAAIDAVEAAYTLPTDRDSWTQDVNLAVLMYSSRLIARRTSPDGVLDFNTFGPIRASGMDPDIAALLAPYRVFRIA